MGADERARRWPPRRIARVVGVHVGVLCAGAVAAIAAVSLGVAVRGPVGPGEVEVRVRAATSGRTELVLPPFGRVSAPTHPLPVALQARVDSLDVEQLQRVLADPAPQTRLRRQVEADLRPLLADARTLVVAVSVVAGAAAGALLPHRRWRFLAVGAAGGLVGVALPLVLTVGTFDARAFERSPTFEGPIERAPALLTAVQSRFDDFDLVVRDRISTLSRRVAQLYAAVATGPDDAAGEVRLLHVSDIHSNPVGIELARQLAEDFDVAAILDTGDITSFGLPVEARIGELVVDLPVPYYLVPGNHDSDENRAALAATPNVTVLDGTMATIAGIDVLGVADPTFTADGEVPTERANLAKLAEAPGVAQDVRRLQPDVLAVHDERQASRAGGLVPLVLAGHTHARSASAETTADGTTITLVVGSTGATGLGSFTVESDLAYEADVLRFRDQRLVAVDRVSFTGVGGAFTIQRLLAADLRAAAPAPPVPATTGSGAGGGG
jgi:predicted phosphodiesterase